MRFGTRRRRSSLWLALGSSGAWLVAACGGSASAVRSRRPLAIAAPPTAAGRGLHPPRAHYVIREPRADFTRINRPPVDTVPIFGPTSTERPHDSVRLGEDTVGVLDGGRRFLAVGNRVAAVDDIGRSGPLAGFVRVPDAFGGGFVFLTSADAYFAKTFTAPLIKLGEHPASQFSLGPGYAFISSRDGFRGFVRLADGKPLANAPSNFREFWAHPGGFLLATTATDVFFGSSLDSWRELPLQSISIAVADQASFITLDARGSAFRVTSSGEVGPISAAEGIDESSLRQRAFQRLRPQPGPTAPGTAPREGSLLDGAWAPTLRSGDEWYGVQNDQVYVLKTASNVMREIGPKLTAGHADCGPKVLSGEPLIVCIDRGSRLRAWRLDLESGARSLETDVQVTRGGVYRLGDAPAYYPQTLFISSSCLGDPSGALCVRDSNGSYATYPIPVGRSALHLDVRSKGEPYIFPGEVLIQSPDTDGALDLQSGAAQYHFDAKTLAEASNTLRWGEATKGLGLPPYVEAGALRTPTSLRLFNIPNPFQPQPNAPVSYALDLSLDGRGQARLLRAPGIVAAAGAHGLRLDQGKLYETNDGWSTWYEVAPPPSGVPSSLAGARCDDRGCALGPWARLGWERPNAFPEPSSHPLPRPLTTCGWQGCAKLGAAYAAARDVHEDDRQAAALETRACAAGEATGCEQLALLYLSGHGVPADTARAIHLLNQACARRDGAHGCVLLGELYLEGDRVPRDSSRAERLFQKACDQGDLDGCLLQGKTAAERGTADAQTGAAALFSRACTGHLSAGCRELGSLSLTGRGVPKDVDRARALFLQACNGGDGVGCTRLAAELETACPRDYLRAFDSYVQGCRAKDAAACAVLEFGVPSNEDLNDEARDHLEDIAYALTTKFEHTKTLCPSAHFGDPAWSCLSAELDPRAAHPSWDALTSQYELRVTPGRGFTAYARHEQAGNAIEWALSGKVSRGALIVSPLYQAPATAAVNALPSTFTLGDVAIELRLPSGYRIISHDEGTLQLRLPTRVPSVVMLNAVRMRVPASLREVEQVCGGVGVDRATFKGTARGSARVVLEGKGGLCVNSWRLARSGEQIISCKAELAVAPGDGPWLDEPQEVARVLALFEGICGSAHEVRRSPSHNPRCLPTP